MKADKEALIPKGPYVSTKKGPNGTSLKAHRADLICWMLKGSWSLGYFSDRNVTLENSIDEFGLWMLWLQYNWPTVLEQTELGQYMLEVTPDLYSLVENSINYFEIELLSSPTLLESDIGHLFKGVWDYSDGLTKPRWAVKQGLNAPSLAKLVVLYEPAGKVRNIVTFDWWSQFLFMPIHKFMMNLLKELDTDATFDQDGKVNEFAKRKYRYIASLDLKAATEWIPQQLYESLMVCMLGQKVAKVWLNLLTLREITPVKDCFLAAKSDTIRYTRGQPMGALSSWAAMALVHHMLVQFCAYLDNQFPFYDYLVLGDDVIIGCRGVAETYKRVCQDLGVKIGLPKSYESRKGFGNFAAQSFLGDVNLSPVSISEEIVIRGPAPRTEQVLRFLRRGFWSLGDAGWFSSLLRLMLHKPAYEQIVKHRREGKMDPLAQMAFMAVFGVPERTKVHSSEIQGFSISSFFGGLTLDMKAFSMPFKPVWSSIVGTSTNVKEMLISACLLKAKTILKRLVPLDEALQEVKMQLQQDPLYGRITALPSGLLLPENQYLRHVVMPFDVFGELTEKCLAWERQYMDLIQRCLQFETDPHLTAKSAEEFLCIPLDVAYTGLLEADDTLQMSLDALGVERPDLERDPDSAIRSFDRLLYHYEHLCEIAKMSEDMFQSSTESWTEDLTRSDLTLTKGH
jgi:hypothetical protein